MPQTNAPTPSSTAPAPANAAADSSANPRSQHAPPSITDFITDGSLAGLCEKITALTGVEVALRDASGARIVRTEEAPHWARVDDGHPAIGATDSGIAGDSEVLVPLRVEGHAIGAISLARGTPNLPAGDQRSTLAEVLSLLASTAVDLCQHQLDLEHRVKEVQALYRLSSMLARATNLDRVLEIALESALDVLELEAGSIVLFEQDEGPTTQTEVDLVLKASRNLSRDWLASPLPLSKDRLFDRLALQGEVVTSRDLLVDDRVFIMQMVRDEGVRAAMHAGMVFQDRPIGVIRVYSRQPRDFGEAEKRLLRSIAQQAAVAVEQARLLKLQERDARIQRQVQLAAAVQQCMLPRRVPVNPRLDVAARYLPSFELGGDFYDFIELGPSLGIAIGDVVGKGLAAALLMSSVRASLRAHVQDIYHIDDIVSRVNAALCRDTLDNEFATLWYGVIDTEKLRLTYCSGGHEPPMIFRAVKGRPPAAADIDELSIGGMAVGIDPSQRYQRGTYDLHPGDVFLAYTDGVTDMLNFERKKFGKARLRQTILQLLTQEPGASAGRITDHLFWELRQFGGILERPDDQTVVIARVK